MATPPPIDSRTAPQITAQVKDLLETYTPGWQEVDSTTGQPDQVATALTAIFGRFAEIIIQRLNQVPQKNFLAFLDLLGASRLPPEPAQVPLTFVLAAGSAVDGLVPPGTQVAAPPGVGETEPVIFETDRELVVTAAQLTSVFVRNPLLDQYAVANDLIPISTAAATSPAVPVFQGNRPIDHSIYLGHQHLLGFGEVAELHLTLTVTQPLPPSAEIRWQIWDGQTWQDKPPMNNQTLTQTGTIQLQFGRLSQPVPLSLVNGQASRWLRGQLKTPITSTEPRPGMVSVNQLPTIENLSLAVRLTRSGRLPDQAFINQLPIDLSKDFFPLGEKPKFGDTFYLASREAFSVANNLVTLTIKFTDPNALDRPANATRNSTLRWEFWDGTVWHLLGTSTAARVTSPPPNQPNEFQDVTQAFTAEGELTVRFRFPVAPQPTTVNGSENFWIRVRLTAGNYGVDAHYVPVPIPNSNPPQHSYVLVASTLRPPSIETIAITYDVTQSAAPEIVLTENDFEYFEYQNYTNQPVVPFSLSPDRVQSPYPSLYLGFTLPANRSDFPNRPLSLFCRTADVKYGERLIPLAPTQSQQVGKAGATVLHKFWLTNPIAAPVLGQLTIEGSDWATSSFLEQSLLTSEGQLIEVAVSIPLNAVSSDRDQGYLKLTLLDASRWEYTASFTTFVGVEIPASDRLQLNWQYWNGGEWTKLTVRDDAENFTRPGLVEFLPPADFSPHREFGGLPNYWLRVQWVSGRYAIEPRLQALLLNTTLATQTITLRNEGLGSSDGSANQVFHTTRTPVLTGQHLDVREPEMPPAQEQIALQREVGEAAITSILDATGRPQEIWVRWQEVPDFYGSAPRDRHYILDHLTGKIQFGDGLAGLIPPTGRGNLRLTHYRTGGGSQGNRGTGTIAQLKTTLPYVEKAINLEAATGGADAESLDLLIDRAPRTLRHRSRAVTLDDYQDLAMLASPAVARTLGVPLQSLNSTLPDAKPIAVPGAVSVILVPRSRAGKPLPSLELISQVQDYLSAHASPTVSIAVIGPPYVQVSVSAEIALQSLEGASAVEQAVEQTLTSFLHPLTGGLDGTGWDFGREPYRSDFYALIEAIPGVDHIRTLTVTETEDQPGTKTTGLFLVYSGKHTINLVFAES